MMKIIAVSSSACDIPYPIVEQHSDVFCQITFMVYEMLPELSHIIVNAADFRDLVIRFKLVFKADKQRLVPAAIVKEYGIRLGCRHLLERGGAAMRHESHGR